MKVSIIQPEEWAELEPIYKAEGGPMPEAGQLRTGAIARDSRGVAGFWAAYMAPHAGPLWVREDWRGQGLWRRLHKTLDTAIDGEYFVLSGEPKTEAIFEKLGFRRTGLQFWKRGR